MTNFLSSSEGSGLPYIVWGSDAVQWRKKTPDGLVVFQPQKAIFDFTNMQWGYMCIEPGKVHKVMVHHSQTPPAKPAGTKKNLQGQDVDAFQKGFSLNVLFGKEFGPVRLYEFSASQKGSVKAVETLFKQYNDGLAANAGKVPVVEFGPHIHEKIGKGSTNIPGLKIVAWVDRPAELDAASVASTTANANAAPVQAAQVNEF